ncbi:rhomboid family intramembrane serine protease [Haliangium sp.]|uniref:rhomboid family intramembrane serine protease n=1 Tax=Haliangium sp. TaxID=2663208 RepID=UPI003D0C1186
MTETDPPAGTPVTDPAAGAPADIPASPGDDWFARVLYALVMDRARPVTVEAAGDLLALVRFPGARTRALLVRYVPGRDELIATRVSEAVAELGGTPLEVALIGGTAESTAVLERVRPKRKRHPVHLYHLRDDGKHRVGPAGRGKTPLWDRLEAPTEPWPPSEELRAVFTVKVRDQVAAAAGARDEMQRFAQGMQARRPIATYALAGVILAVYGLQLLWGATDNTPGLARMGAMVPQKVRDGEVWRLISCAFLHAGLMHLAFNTLVLVMLGKVLERILGTSRFLLLYGASAVAGSLASFLAGDARVSVGASGALWGILVADAVLAFRPRGLLPAVVIDRAKRAALTNLVLNVANSFRPQVDMAAHFGGGAIGALLIGTGALTMGLRPIDAAEEAAPSRTPGWVRAGAVVSVGILGLGLVLGLVMGQPWTANEPPTLVERSVPEVGITVALPTRLEVSESVTEGDGATVLFGDLLDADPAMVELTRAPFDVPLGEDDAGVEQGIDAVMAAMEQTPEGTEGATVRQPPARFEAGGRPAVSAIYRLQNGLLIERVVVLFRDHLVRVDVFYSPELSTGYDGLARQIADSLRPLDPS